MVSITKQIFQLHTLSTVKRLSCFEAVIFSLFYFTATSDHYTVYFQSTCHCQHGSHYFLLVTLFHHSNTAHCFKLRPTQLTNSAHFYSHLFFQEPSGWRHGFRTVKKPMKGWWSWEASKEKSMPLACNPHPLPHGPHNNSNCVLQVLTIIIQILKKSLPLTPSMHLSTHVLLIFI